MLERGLDPESFLTEVDRRLREIQDELRPGEAGPRRSAPRADAALRMDAPSEPPRRGRSGPLAAILGRTKPPAKPAEPSQPEPQPAEPADARRQTQSPPAGQLVEQVRALTEVQTQLLAASERLLEAFAQLVHDAPAAPQAQSAAPPGLFAATARRSLSVSAGPFADTEALHEFERAVEQLERVHRVTVRAYEGNDRAILDVELEPGPSGETA
jgi:hypothetical protein